MVAASLLHYLRGHNRTLVSAALLLALLAALCLFAYAVLAGGLTTDPLPDGQLLGPFRWKEHGVNLG